MLPARALFASALLATTLTVPAHAACSRPISVPAAASGHSVAVKGNQVGGMFPEMLALIGARTGCTFHWSIVPRERLESMFASGRADLLVAATQVDRRDRHGIFVPMFETRPMLIAVAGLANPVRSLDDLLARRELRVVLVRGFDYGPAYRDIVAKLQAQGRVYMRPDPQSAARMLADSMADVTIMPSGVFIVGTREDPRTEALAGKLRAEPIPELPWVKSGLYLSRTSLSPADRKTLVQAIEASVRSGLWWQAMRRYYPGDILAGSTRRFDPRRHGTGVTPPPP